GGGGGAPRRGDAPAVPRPRNVGEGGEEQEAAREDVASLGRPGNRLDPLGVQPPYQRAEGCGGAPFPCGASGPCKDPHAEEGEQTGVGRVEEETREMDAPCHLVAPDPDIERQR